MVRNIKDYHQFFADEKMMKNIDIYGKKVRQNITNRDIPNRLIQVNAQNRYSILATVTVKGGGC